MEISLSMGMSSRFLLDPRVKVVQIGLVVAVTAVAHCEMEKRGAGERGGL